MFAGKKSAQIREILISESAWEEMTCLFAPSLRTAINLFAKIRANKSFDKDDEKTLKRLSGFKYNLEEKDPNYDLITALESMKVIYG